MVRRSRVRAVEKPCCLGTRSSLPVGRAAMIAHVVNFMFRVLVVRCAGSEAAPKCRV